MSENNLLYSMPFTHESERASAGQHRRGVRRCLGSIMGGMLVMLAMLGMGSPAQAALITLEFTVADFPPTRFSNIAAPYDPVSGVITYEAADVGSPIESLASVSLTIGSHSYLVGELGFVTNPSSISTSSIIGGSLNNVTGVQPFTNDFSLQYDRVGQPGVGANFIYTTADLFGTWRSLNFTSFSLTEASMPVPEPGTLGLVLLGLLMAVPLLRRRVL